MKKTLIIMLLFLGQTMLCFGLDWKNLHEQADKTSLPVALAIVQKNAQEIDNLYILGLIYLNLHRDKEAKECFARIISLNPSTIEAEWGIAEVLRRQHNLDQAEALLLEIKSANPEFSPAYISLAYIRYIQFNFEESVRLAYKVLGQSKDKVDLSNYVRAYLLVAGAKGMIAHYGGPLSKLINGTAVLPNLEKAQRLQPDSAGVLFGLGSFYFLAPGLVGGDVKKAKDYLEKAVSIDPLFADAYVRLAQVYKINRNDEKYQFYLNEALRIDPKNELALDVKEKRCKFVCTAGEK